MPPGSKYVPGALVHVRSRDWVVLPPEEPEVVRLRPVDGSDADAVGIYLPLEPEALKPSEYQQPDPKVAGDFTGSLLLRDAVRLSLRSGAGPFRSMGRLSVAPRRARQSAESLLMHGMFRRGGNITQTVSELLDTKRWLSHSQMISWADAKDPRIGLIVEYLQQNDDLWQDYWRLYCLQRLAVGDNQKLYESDRASHIIDTS